MSTAMVQIVDGLRTKGGIKGSDLANITDVSPATVSRWANGTSSPHPKTQLVISDLKYIVDRLAEIYSPEETRIWLYARHPLLGGARAIDCIHDGRTEEVLVVIESLLDGSYS